MLNFSGLICVGLITASWAWGAVDHLEVISRTPVLDGRAFGVIGSFEKITGRVHFRVKPDEPHNRVVVDLDKAPRNAQGQVEFSADFWLIRPKVFHKGNGGLLLEIPTRGRKSLLADVNGGTPSPEPTKDSDFGDRWLLRQGYTIAALGWQWDLPDRAGIMRLSAPIAQGADGKPITGLLRHEFTPAEKTNSVGLGHAVLGAMGGTEYPVSNPDDPRNVLTVRDGPTAERRTIPREEWSFSREESHVEAGTRHRRVIPDTNFVFLKSGFAPGKIYELVYVVQDPVVAGLGLAAVRDFVSYLKNDPNDVVSVLRAYGVGASQGGRFLRQFLYQNFNADEQGRQVFDGVIATTAGAGRGSFNHRFAQPSRDPSPMSAFSYPIDIFPFTDLPQTDPVTGEKAGLLDAASAAQVVPKIFYANTSYEYWARAASLIHTSPDGANDADLAPSTRIYFFPGLGHIPGPFPPARGTGRMAELQGQYPANPNTDRWFKRALISNMNGWVRDRIEPPVSAYPRIDDLALVPADRVQFPLIPDVQFPSEASPALRLDFGPSWNDGVVSNQPPKTGTSFPVLVPQVNEDGNELVGVFLPELTLPLATYTGWNLRSPAIGAPGQRVAFIGSYFPLHSTAEEREKANDPRNSVGERYASEEEYLTKFREIAKELVNRRWMLREDLPAVLARAKSSWQQVKPAEGAGW